ncbi:MAG TPA: hypothetical protein VGH86_17645 [Phenylobacterium sp.]|jgi:hypothetical protein
MPDDLDRQPARPDDEATSELRARVIDQAPAVFVTLVSVLVGLVLSDLVTEARAHMHLWPLDFMAVRTWGQLFSNGTSALSVWIVLAHLGIARRRVPHLTETLSAFAPPMLLLAAASFVGRPEIWPWFYGASAYLVTALVADIFNVRLTMDQPSGRRFARLLHPLRHHLVIYLGAPTYLLGGYLDQHGWLPSAPQLALAFLPIPAALTLTWTFFQDWRTAVAGSGR